LLLGHVVSSGSQALLALGITLLELLCVECFLGGARSSITVEIILSELRDLARLFEVLTLAVITIANIVVLHT